MAHRNYTQVEARQNKEADYFARCILLPENFLKKALKKLQETENLTLQQTVKSLAKKFGVEEVRVTMRLNDLKLIQ